LVPESGWPHPNPGERDYIDLDDEEGILRAATEIRQRRIVERGRVEAAKQEAARLKLHGKRTWTITDNPKVVRCDLLIVDPPFGLTKEPWEPEDVEAAESFALGLGQGSPGPIRKSIDLNSECALRILDRIAVT